MQYASFGKAPAYPAVYSAWEAACYTAGRVWAEKGNEKLPRMAEVQVGNESKKVPVVRSSHPFGLAFVAGWKAGRQEAA